MNVTASDRAPAASVVLPCFNGAATIGMQLEALTRQVDAPAFEVIVVDNGSTDDLAGALAPWRERLDVRMVRATEHQGVSYARNVGLREAACEDVIFLDADDCAGPGFVRAAVSALAETPFVSGHVLPLRAEVFDGGVDAVWAWLATQEAPAGTIDIDRSYPVFMGGASAVRRSEALALGGFDQAFFPGAEDNDFGLRVVKAGYRLVRSFGMVLAERVRATSGQAFTRAYRGGRMHMRLCAVHDLWGVSPHLTAPVWWVDLLKLPAAAAKCLVLTRGADRQSMASRAGLRFGQAQGFWDYRVRRADLTPQVGLGLEGPVSG